MKTTGGKLAPGTRVRISAPQSGLTLQSRHGTIVRQDDDEYYLIKLDKPALYDRGLGESPEELPKIIEMIDNVTIVSSAKPTTLSKGGVSFWVGGKRLICGYAARGAKAKEVPAAAYKVLRSGLGGAGKVIKRSSPKVQRRKYG